jgi:hypothetical protein
MEGRYRVATRRKPLGSGHSLAAAPLQVSDVAAELTGRNLTPGCRSCTAASGNLVRTAGRSKMKCDCEPRGRPVRRRAADSQDAYR